MHFVRIITLSMTSEEKERDLAFIKLQFSDRMDNSGRFAWQHALHAAEYLAQCGEESGEVISEERCDVFFRACLGHDLLEDTHVTEEEIESRWGGEVLHLIQGMTNKKGDTDFDDYIEHLSHTSDEVLLVKLADIWSNVSHSVTKWEIMDKEWVVDFWLPLLHRYEHAFFHRPIETYPKTTERMKRDIHEDIRTLENLVHNFPIHHGREK